MKKIYLFIAICCLTVINAFAQTSCSISLTSAPGTDAQTVCKNTSLVDITYQVSGTGATVSNLPSGVAGSFAAGVFTISGTPAVDGTFNYTVTTTGGCTPDASATGSITVNPLPALSSSLSLAICSGSTANYTPTSSSAGASFTWSRSTMSGISEAGTSGTGSLNEVLTNTTTSNISVTYLYTTSANGCSNAGENFVVDVNPSPVVTVNDVTVCEGSSATLTANGASAYSWSDNSTLATITVTPTVTTSYTVTGSTAGCSASEVATVAVIPSDDASFNYGGPSAFCNIGSNPTPTITGTTGGTFSCTNTGLTINSTTGLIDLASSTIGTYTVTYNTSGQCGASSDFVINIIDAPDATFAYSGPYCQNAPNPLAVFPAGSTPGTFTSTAGLVFVNTGIGEINLAASTPGTYTVSNTIPAGGGCPAVVYETTITINPSPVVTVNSPAICYGLSGTLTASGANTYSWSDGSTVNPKTVSPTNTTSYTVTGTTAGCSSQAVATVNITQTPVVTVNSVTICQGSTATLTAGGGTTYVWAPGGATGNSLTVSPVSTTSYTVTDNSVGCSGQAIATVVVNPLPLISVNNATICAGQSASLNASGGTTYLWSTGSTSNPMIVSPVATASYTLTGNPGGCSNTVLATVTVQTAACTPVSNPLTVVVSSTDAGNSTICNGTAYATVTGGVPPYSINFGNTTVTDSVYAITNLCAGFYTANATDAQSNSTSFTFVVGSPATTFPFTDLTFVDSVVVDTLVTNGIPNCVINYDIIDSITITNFSFVGFDSINVIWSIYQGGTSNTQNAFYQFSMPGVYTFILDLFCTNRATGSVKGIDQVHVNKSATGIETYTNSVLSVYPNPSNGAFTVTLSGVEGHSLNEGTYSIINELGQILQQFKLSATNQYTVNIENLSDGIYFIVGDSIQQKIVVIK